MFTYECFIDQWFAHIFVTAACHLCVEHLLRLRYRETMKTSGTRKRKFFSKLFCFHFKKDLSMVSTRISLKANSLIWIYRNGIKMRIYSFQLFDNSFLWKI
jgi:hypothetical protein